MCRACEAARDGGIYLLAEKNVYFGVLGDALLQMWLESDGDRHFVLTSTIVSARYGDGYIETNTEIKFCPLCGHRLNQQGRGEE